VGGELTHDISRSREAGFTVLDAVYVDNLMIPSGRYSAEGDLQAAAC
jgi:hypothetical protein